MLPRKRMWKLHLNKVQKNGSERNARYSNWMRMCDSAGASGAYDGYQLPVSSFWRIDSRRRSKGYEEKVFRKLACSLVFIFWNWQPTYYVAMKRLSTTSTWYCYQQTMQLLPSACSKISSRAPVSRLRARLELEMLVFECTPNFKATRVHWIIAFTPPLESIISVCTAFFRINLAKQILNQIHKHCNRLQQQGCNNNKPIILIMNIWPYRNVILSIEWTLPSNFDSLTFVNQEFTVLWLNIWPTIRLAVKLSYVKHFSRRDSFVFDGFCFCTVRLYSIKGT